MKSFVNILPFAGLALAQAQCGPGITVTETSTEKITVTVQPSSYVAPSAINTVSAQDVKPSPKPQSPYYPIGNSTANGPTNYPTHTPHAPTTLETLALPSDVIPSSSSSKKVKTVFIVPTPAQDVSSAVSSASSAAVISTPAAAAPAQSSPAAEPAAAAAQDTTSAASVTGSASFYGGNLAGGACSFTGYTLPSSLFGTAFGGSWDASQCGSCVAVTNSAGKTIKAMIVDQCPECPSNKLDLFEYAFTQLGPKSAGIIPITYTPVPCDITSPLVLKNKEGVSPFWFSMQVMNANVAIASLSVSTDGGATWKATTRSKYNFWENTSGFGTSSVDVKVTGTNGKSVVVKGVSVSPGVTKEAGGNI